MSERSLRPLLPSSGLARASRGQIGTGNFPDATGSVSLQFFIDEELSGSLKALHGSLNASASPCIPSAKDPDVQHFLHPGPRSSQPQPSKAAQRRFLSSTSCAPRRRWIQFRRPYKYDGAIQQEERPNTVSVGGDGSAECAAGGPGTGHRKLGLGARSNHHNDRKASSYSCAPRNGPQDLLWGVRISRRKL